MFRWRLALGASIIAALVALCWLDYRADQPGWWLLPLALLLSLLASQEFLSLLAVGNLRPVGWVVYIGNLAIVAAAGVPILWKDYPADCPLGPLGWPLAALAVGIMLAFAGEMWRYEKPGGVIVHVAVTVFALAYVGLMLAFLVELRIIGGSLDGVTPLVAMIVTVKMGDTGAYTVGRMIGRHKLAPVLSPGKTWEGVGGAIGFAVVGSYATFALMRPATIEEHPWAPAVWGAALAVVGIFGDLAESLLKRDMGRKDSSTWMPGFGGVLDLVDSLLIAAPVAYLLWIAVIQ